MGVIFLAKHSILGRLPALKLIILDLTKEAETFIESKTFSRTETSQNC